MKALIRNPGETVLETYEIPCIDWNTGAPLTNPGWFGGPYQLVDNYIEVADGPIYDVATYPEPPEEPEEVPQEEEVVEDDDYVVINGVRYTKEELRKLIE